jgi:hypothetical protein
MKFKLLFLLLFLIVANAAASRLTYYGPSGYIFVPSGFVSNDWKYSGFTGGDFTALQNMRLYPKFLAFRTSAFSDRLEIAVSSSYEFAGDDGYKVKKLGAGLLPVSPSLKWNIADNEGRIVRMGYSAGIVYAYGLYGSITTQFGNLPILQPEFTFAISIGLERGYGMLGGRLQTANFSGEALPLAFTAEAGWSSSTNFIGKMEESFVAFGSELDLGRNLTLLGGFRLDPSTYYNFDNAGKKTTPKEGQNTNGKWSLRLEFHFDGVKSTGEKKL